jgi:hypothetical protein
VDLYDASSLTTVEGTSSHPFASAWGSGIQQQAAGAVALNQDDRAAMWNLMYVMSCSSWLFSLCNFQHRHQYENA